MPGEAAKNRPVTSLTVTGYDPKHTSAWGDSFDDTVADEERHRGYKRPEDLRHKLATLAESGQEYRLD